MDDKQIAMAMYGIIEALGEVEIKAKYSQKMTEIITAMINLRNKIVERSEDNNENAE